MLCLYLRYKEAFFRSKVFLANAKEKLALSIELELGKSKHQVEVREDKVPVDEPNDPPTTTSLPIAQQIAKKIRLENQQQVSKNIGSFYIPKIFLVVELPQSNMFLLMFVIIHFPVYEAGY